MNGKALVSVDLRLIGASQVTASIALRELPEGSAPRGVPEFSFPP
jgi:hypothetical protein